MYGTQTRMIQLADRMPFENDVEMYGTQTSDPSDIDSVTFENDVEMYGTQTFADLNDIFL